MGTGSQPAPRTLLELEVEAAATAAAITTVANNRRSDFFMGFPLRVMSNPRYQRNPVTGYFRLGQYQWVPNLKTFISVDICGKTRPNSWILHTKWR